MKSSRRAPLILQVGYTTVLADHTACKWREAYFFNSATIAAGLHKVRAVAEEKDPAKRDVSVVSRTILRVLDTNWKATYAALNSDGTEAAQEVLAEFSAAGEMASITGTDGTTGQEDDDLLSESEQNTDG